MVFWFSLAKLCIFDNILKINIWIQTKNDFIWDDQVLQKVSIVCHLDKPIAECHSLSRIFGFEFLSFNNNKYKDGILAV